MKQKGSILEQRPKMLTERLLLRRPSDGDVGPIASIVGDWEVARRLARVPHPYGAADAAFFLERVVPAEWVWAITLRGSDELVGAIGLTPQDGKNVAELGYWLSHAEWGRGIVTEAGRAVVSCGFDKLNLAYITSGHFEENPTSARVLEKLGFVEVGRAQRPCLAARTDVPSIEMRLLRSVTGHS